MTDADELEQIEKAVNALRAGEVIGFPTETVYGLGADATNSEAIAKIYEIKGRPTDHPLIVHIKSKDDLVFWVREVPEAAMLLAEAFWPGALTIILQRNGKVADEVVGAMTTIALRVPDHELTLKMLESFDGGVAGPSANKFGGVSPTSADHVSGDLGDDVSFVLDGGKCTVGVESTIIDLVNEPTILRHGGVSKEAIESILSTQVIDGTEGESRAPGMMRSHYAPRAKVILTTEDEILNPDFVFEPNSGLVGPVSVEGVTSWTMPNNASGYARSIYAVLREADSRGLETIYIVPPTEGEILEAVLDRLAKASAPRS